MKIREFKESIACPEGVTLAVTGRTVKMTGKNGECSKEFKMPRFVFSQENNNVVITCKDYNFYDKRNFLTVKAHLGNMIKGVQEGFEYKLKICSSHFPMNVTVSNNKLIVKNLLGEKVPRELIIKKGVSVKVEGTEIVVLGSDIELVSTVASDMEQLTRNTDRDRRIFQDGIYITHKAGKEI